MHTSVVSLTVPDGCKKQPDVTGSSSRMFQNCDWLILTPGDKSVLLTCSSVLSEGKSFIYE